MSSLLNQGKGARRLSKAGEADPAAVAGAADEAAEAATDREPSRRRRKASDATGASSSAPAILTAGDIPDPEALEGASAEGDLSDREREVLAICEAAIDNLRLAFWAAGRAIATIHRNELWRGKYGSFEEYLSDRHGIALAQGYRLMNAYPLAEHLSKVAEKLNEAQVRELLPFSDRYGLAAAETVYRTVAETGNGKITASLLKGAAGAADPGGGVFDADTAVERIRAYLAGELNPAVPTGQPAVQQFDKEVRRFRKLLRKVEAPAAERQRIAEQLRALADELTAEPT